MAHGENAIKENDKQWWGKRPLAGQGVPRKKSMKFWKKLLHKIERKLGKKEIKENLNK